MDNRVVKVSIAGTDYDMVCTTRAALEIENKYGSMEKLAEKLTGMKNLTDNFSELLWLLALLINQGILIHNFKHRDEKPLSLVAEDELALLTFPNESEELWARVWEAIQLGMKRNVVGESFKGEDDSKNLSVG